MQVLLDKTAAPNKSFLKTDLHFVLQHVAVLEKQPKGTAIPHFQDPTPPLGQMPTASHVGFL